MTPPSPADVQQLLAQRERLPRLARRLLGDGPNADDLTQETLARALESRPPRGTTRGWLATVARNLFLDSRRWNKVRAADIAWSDAVDAFLATEPSVLVDDRIQVMRDCLEQLEGRVRQALELRHRDGIAQETIAAELGLRVNGLKAMLRRARNLLRDCVTRHGHRDENRNRDRS